MLISAICFLTHNRLYAVVPSYPNAHKHKASIYYTNSSQGVTMCGIAGFCNFGKNFLNDTVRNLNILDDMSKSLAHRGHDNFGKYLKEHCGFCHSRLSIRDIAGGNQPMLKNVSGREYAICYNGEIYNTDELKAELESLGVHFETTSDTEIILAAFIEYGPEFVNMLNGIFAFAIWDDSARQLYMYRDRVGVKPFFYAPAKNGLVFASEPKALFRYPGIVPEIDLQSMQEILGIGPAKTPGISLFKNVREILPGHYIIFNEYGYCDKKYWDVTYHEHTDDYQTTVEKVSYLVRDAVKRQMISDVPVCTFLSGGLDSSIVTSLAYSFLNGEKLNTFSFDFNENDIYFSSNSFQPERDEPYVNIMLEHFPTNHEYLRCNEKQLFDSLFESVIAKDAPGMADVDASLLFFCSLVAAKNKVALTGECADEIFGGYPWLYRPELMNRDDFPWSADADARTMLLSADWQNRLELNDYAHDAYRTSLSRLDLPAMEVTERRRLEIGYLNIKWFMQTLLDRMDRASMHSGLEARVPFADHRIIEYVYSIPWSMKYQNGVEKHLLRKATLDLLPEELSKRKKSPYPKTYHPGYEALLKDALTEIISDKSSPILPLLDIEKVKAFIAAPKELGKPWYGQLMAGPQLMAYYIQLNYWMKQYRLELP